MTVKGAGKAVSASQRRKMRGSFGSDDETVRTLLADAAIAMLRDGGLARDVVMARLGKGV